MDMYKLYRDFWNYCFENPDIIKPTDIAIYSFAIEHCNRLGWKEKFGLPSTMVMEATSIKSYNTYIQALNKLVDIGFIKMVEKSKNQYSSNIIALSNFNKAQYKALDKALIKHCTKQIVKQRESTVQSTVQSTDSIDIQVYNNTNIQFYNFWDLYGLKREIKACQDKWSKLKPQEKEKAIKAIPLYIASLSDIKYQKHPATYINKQVWLDFEEDMRPKKTKLDFTDYQDWLKYCSANNINPQEV